MLFQNKRVFAWIFIFVIVVSTFMILSLEPIDLQDNFKNVEMADTGSSPKLWVTMGLCFSEGNSMKLKNEVFYSALAPLAITLWEHFTNAQVILSVIYIMPKTESEKKEFLISQKAFMKSLATTSAIVEWIPHEESDPMSCATKSQMIRMFSFRRPIIKPDDIVMTSDVDAFVASSDLMDPLALKQTKVWIYRYGHGLAYEIPNFPMCFIAMRASLWEHLFKAYQTPDQLFEDMSIRLNVDTKGNKKTKAWFTDQLSATYLILREKLCTLPERVSTWKQLALEYSPTEDGCWHGGFEYSCCDLEINLPKCLWWHFLSHETPATARNKFLEIVGGHYSVTHVGDTPYYLVQKKK